VVFNLFFISILVRCLFGSGGKVSFDQEQIQSTTFAWLTYTETLVFRVNYMSLYNHVIGLGKLHFQIKIIQDSHA
jgi:hypothetical protein